MSEDAAWLRFLPEAIRSRIAGRRVLQAVIGNSGWLFLDKVIRLLSGVVVGVWLARYLGPQQFGELNFAIAFVALFSPLATLGLDAIVVRELIRRPDDRGEILGSAFSLKVLGASTGVVFVLVAIQLLRPADDTMLWMVGIIAVGMIFQTFDVFDFWFQSQVKSKFTVYVKGAAYMTCAIAKVVLILSDAALVAFAWVAMVEIALGGVGLAAIYTQVEQRPPQYRLALWRWPKIRELLGSSWPLFLSGVAVMVYFRIDQVMIAQISGEKEVGLYSAALRLSEVWYTIPTVLVGSATPALIEAHGRSDELYYQRLQRVFTTLARIAYVVAIPVSLLASVLVPLVYGEQFADAAPILTIHIWTALFVFLGIGLGPWMISEGMTRFYLWQTSAGAVANVVLNLFLIPRFGAVGASVATLVSQIVATYLAMSVLPKTRKIFYMETKALLLRG